ncbi:hypothetical protein BC834DRAFT_974765 [Gloeopeniophorella convolvens]|nr:hypothetical protein BC834DRAFT_974765 [Gloeopeniophorella convolvens]
MIDSRGPTIYSLPDELLLEIFEWYRKPWDRLEKRLQWHQVVPAHVCRRWRQLVVSSPKRLHLYIYCKSGPISHFLEQSPNLPLKVDYRFNDRPSWLPEVLDDVLLSLSSHLQRIAEMRLQSRPHILHLFLSMVNQRVPSLEALQVTSLSSQMRLPDTLLNGNAPNLRKIYLAKIRPPIPFAPSVTDLFFEPPGVADDPTWFAQLVGALRTMSQLRNLTLQLHSSAFAPLEGVEQTTLQQLSKFKFIGLGSHLEALLSRFGAPLLMEFKVYLSDSSVIISTLQSFPRFISESASLRCPVASLGLDLDCIYVEARTHRSSKHRGSFLFQADRVDDSDMQDSVAAISWALERVFLNVRTVTISARGFRAGRTDPDDPVDFC